jgi:hypothetical protein
MEKHLTIVINPNNKFMRNTFDELANKGCKNTYLIDSFNKILIDANHYYFRNILNDIMKETKKRVSRGNEDPAFVLIDEFDRMCTVSGINKIFKEVFVPFLEAMPVETHLYIKASSYETCRNRTCLLASGETKILTDYEEWRNLNI